MKVGDFLVRHTNKGERFEKLIKKGDMALKKDFCIEASTIYYALIEERFYSFFDLIGVSINQRDIKVYHCIQMLLNIIDNGHYAEQPSDNSDDNLVDPNLRTLIISEYKRGLLIDINKWRVKRNSITHDFAKVDINYNDIRKYAKSGKKHLRELLSSSQRFKKKLKKLNITP